MICATSITAKQAFDFASYYQLADELDGGLQLADFKQSIVRSAERAAKRFGLPWVPDLEAAYEFSTAHRALLDAADLLPIGRA